MEGINMSLCQVCQKNAIAMKITRIVDGVPTEYSVCAQCAPSISPHQAKLHSKKAKKISVENLLKQIIAQGESGAKSGGGELAEDNSCPDCGLPFARYRQTLMLGCPGCYEAFGEEFLADVQKIQGTTHHIEESAPAQQRILADAQARLAALRHEMENCIRDEDFGRAAGLRDQIRLLQASLAVESEG